MQYFATTADDVLSIMSTWGTRYSLVALPGLAVTEIEFPNIGFFTFVCGRASGALVSGAA